MSSIHEMVLVNHEVAIGSIFLNSHKLLFWRCITTVVSPSKLNSSIISCAKVGNVTFVIKTHNKRSSSHSYKIGKDEFHLFNIWSDFRFGLIIWNKIFQTNSKWFINSNLWFFILHLSFEFTNWIRCLVWSDVTSIVSMFGFERAKSRCFVDDIQLERELNTILQNEWDVWQFVWSKIRIISFVVVWWSSTRFHLENFRWIVTDTFFSKVKSQQ